MHRFSPQPADVVAVIDIAVPPERVFRALTDPEELAQWWVGTGTSGLPAEHHWDIDARPRGEWRVTSHDALGREGTARGEYRVVDPPHVLEFSWQASWDGFALTTVRCELEPIDVCGTPGTRLRVTHTAAGAAVACAGIANRSFSWTRAVESLQRHVVAAPSHRPLFVAHARIRASIT